MAYRLCKKCGGIVEDANSCIDCGNDEFMIYDEILSLKGTNYTFQQDKQDKRKWAVYGGSQEYLCEIKDPDATVLKVSCSCTGYKYRGKCKHALAIKEHLTNRQGSIAKVREQVVLAKKRHKRQDLTNLVKDLDKSILKGIKYEVAGSYRRKTSDSKDLDILVVGFKKKVIQSRLEQKYPGGDKPLPGDKVAPSGGKSGQHILRWYVPIGKDGKDTISLDFHFTTPSEFEPVLLYFTGSLGFNLKMRSTAVKKGYALNRYGLWERKNKDTLVARSEKDIFKALDIAYVPPERR